MPSDLLLPPLHVSLRVCGLALCLWLPLGLLFAWRLGRAGQFRGRWLLESLLTLPLVLPPTVIGYALLWGLGRQTLLGRWLQDTLHLPLVFTVWGAALAAAIVALPLFVRTGAAAIADVRPELLEVARVSGATEAQVLRHIFLPLAYRGLLAAFLLAFTRALGEFGATVIIAGSIPGETETLPLALYNAIQAGSDRDAAYLVLVLASLGIAATLTITLLTRRLGTQQGAA